VTIKVFKAIGRSIFPDHAIAVGCLSLAFLEQFAILLRGGFWRNPSLSWLLRIELGTLSLLTWCCLGWAWSWFIAALRLMRRCAHMRLLSTAVLAAFIVVFVATYVASLMTYWRIGEFPTYDAIQFLLVNPRMLLHYFLQTERLSLLQFVIVVTVGSAFYFWLSRVSLLRSTRSPYAVGIAFCFVTLNFTIGVVLLDKYSGRLDKDEFWKPQPKVELQLASNVDMVFSLGMSTVYVDASKPEGTLTESELGPPRRLSPSPSPNAQWQTPVIVVAIESLRHDVPGAQRNGRLVMPTLTNLARNGRWFRRAYAQSTHSDYADPCLLSSLYPLRAVHHHYYQRSDPWPKVLIYDVLKAMGYSTAIFSSQNESWGNMDVFLESPSLDRFFDSRAYSGPTYVSDNDTGFSTFAKEARVAGKLDDAVTMTEACNWIRQCASAHKPFFIYLNLQSSHFPYHSAESPPPFQPSTMDFPASFAGYPIEKVEIVRNAYFNSLHYIDLQLDRLLRVLEETHIRQRTLLMLAGDNGEAFYENGYPTHAGPPYEPAIHVACVMSCPDRLAPALDDNLLQMIDFGPTILGLLGQSPNPSFQGRDVLDRQSPALDRQVCFIHCATVFTHEDAVVSGIGWKLVVNYRDGSMRLYDLRKDPGERTNLVIKEPSVVQVLLALHQQWRRRQLIYYQSQPYYSIYCAPRTPRITDEQLTVLEGGVRRPSDSSSADR
jgi:arylsulfatase A-like enzyme